MTGSPGQLQVGGCVGVVLVLDRHEAGRVRLQTLADHQLLGLLERQVLQRSAQRRAVLIPHVLLLSGEKGEEVSAVLTCDAVFTSERSDIDPVGEGAPGL